MGAGDFAQLLEDDVEVGIGCLNKDAAETSKGTINFHEWISNGWAILF